MGTENLEEKIAGLLENEAFKAELKNVKGKDDLQKTFAKFGVDLTQEEVDALASQIEMSLSNDELSIEQLEHVAGGGLLGGLLKKLVEVIVEEQKRKRRNPWLKSLKN